MVSLSRSAIPHKRRTRPSHYTNSEKSERFLKLTAACPGQSTTAKKESSSARSASRPMIKFPTVFGAKKSFESSSVLPSLGVFDKTKLPFSRAEFLGQSCQELALRS